jgi:mannose-1-phosphate guanylyltransferase
MNIILLSGGSGKRLWPLSNDVRSKQFLKLITDKSGARQSMVQRVFGQIRAAYPDANIVIATSQTQLDNIRGQINSEVDVVLEPMRRDTYPAVVLSCAHMALNKGADLDEPVIALPIDPYTEIGFFRSLERLEGAIRAKQADIALIGIRPTFPTSKYGYIVPGGIIADGVYSVTRFVEKPDVPAAEELIGQDALWNGGVFAFRLGYIMDIARSDMEFSSFDELRDRFHEFEEISFDYKVVEKAASRRRVAVTPFDGMWTDIGTWRTLTDEMTENILGPASAEDAENTYIVNELNIPLVALGTKDLIIAASPDGILVSDLVRSSDIKPAVDKLENKRPMYEERRWGEYTVVEKSEYEDGGGSLVKHLLLRAGKSISYQRHRHRDEIWAVASGSGSFVLDNERRHVSIGDVLRIRRGQKHAVLAYSDLHIVEVQLGNILTEDDIEKFDWEWE